METPKAHSVCNDFGCRLLQYQEGTLAAIQLPSGEQVLVSMGASSIKVMQKRPILGWLFCKAVLSVNLAQFGWSDCIPLTRAVLSVILVDAVMELVIRARSIPDMLHKYEGNFADLVASEMNTQMSQYTGDQDKSE